MCEYCPRLNRNAGILHISDSEFYDVVDLEKATKIINDAQPKYATIWMTKCAMDMFYIKKQLKHKLDKNLFVGDIKVDYNYYCLEKQEVSVFVVFNSDYFEADMSREDFLKRFSEAHSALMKSRKRQRVTKKNRINISHVKTRRLTARQRRHLDRAKKLEGFDYQFIKLTYGVDGVGRVTCPPVQASGSLYNTFVAKQLPDGSYMYFTMQPKMRATLHTIPKDKLVGLSNKEVEALIARTPCVKAEEELNTVIEKMAEVKL